MTESRTSFLYNIAMSHQSENTTSNILRSFYLMRTVEVTGGYGLPKKLFSSETRCPQCCLEWKDKQDVKIKAINLSKRHKLKNHTGSKSGCERPRCNMVERTCSFCNHTSTTTSLKPANAYPNKAQSKPITDNSRNIEKPQPISNKSKTKKSNIKTKEVTLTNPITSVYSNAANVFSLKNKCNTLSSTIKVAPKIIKNNKKRKDKFAGLCQKAVLASAKQDVGPKKLKPVNKLGLLLKPSSG